MRIKEKNYVDQAEEVIKKVKDIKNQRGKLVGLPTTSQIRNILAMTSDIYNEVLNVTDETLPDKLVGQIEYLRIRVVYEYGRDVKDGAVQNFIKYAELLEILEEIKSSRANFILFNRYMEALVAFHKFYGGRD